jgi:tetratricopeptide (TPR) repeat protein
MSQTHTISQPPEPLTATHSRRPPALYAEAVADIERAVRRLHAELEATTDKARQGRLLAQIADLQERLGDEPSAARDYLAAYNADPSFREPLEGLVRLLERRRSLKNLGRLGGALVRAAASPDEKVRALLMRAAHQSDVAGELAEAKASVLEATQMEAASTAERASAWLSLEVLAGRTGDPATRIEALGQRVPHAHQTTWRALLLLDRARLVEAAGDADAALTLIEEARALGSQATWTATLLLEQVAHDHPGVPGSDTWRARVETCANAVEMTADLIGQAIEDPTRGDALGVPHWARSLSRRVEAWMRAAEARRSVGQLDRAGAILDRALDQVGSAADEDPVTAAAIGSARIRVAELTGDTALAARLAERRLVAERSGTLGAALAMRVAEHAASEGDATRALEALSRAIASDPGCLPARALQLDMLADGGDPAAFAAQLESFADHLATDEARARAFLLAAYVWGMRANDVAGAKAALSQASMYGFAPGTTGRIARALASIADDAAWYEDATKRLVSAGAGESEVLSLYVELVRLRHARGDAEGEARALRDLAGVPRGAWLARVLEAFLPPPAAPAEPGADARATSERARAALEELAARESDPQLARGLALVAATRAQAAGADARTQLRALADLDPSDVLVAVLLADFDRPSWPRRGLRPCGRNRQGAQRPARRRGRGPPARGAGFARRRRRPPVTPCSRARSTSKLRSSAGERGHAKRRSTSSKRRQRTRLTPGGSRSGGRRAGSTRILPRGGGAASSARCRGTWPTAVPSPSSASPSRWAAATPTRRRRR